MSRHPDEKSRCESGNSSKYDRYEHENNLDRIKSHSNKDKHQNTMKGAHMSLRKKGLEIYRKEMNLLIGLKRKIK
jgi:hypothetical protein